MTFFKSIFCSHPQSKRVSIAFGCMDASEHSFCEKCNTLFIDPWDAGNYSKKDIRKEYKEYFESYNVSKIKVSKR